MKEKKGQFRCFHCGSYSYSEMASHCYSFDDRRECVNKQRQEAAQNRMISILMTKVLTNVLGRRNKKMMFKKSSPIKGAIKKIQKIDNEEDLLKIAAQLDEQKKKLKANQKGQ